MLSFRKIADFLKKVRSRDSGIDKNKNNDSTISADNISAPNDNVSTSKTASTSGTSDSLSTSKTTDAMAMNFTNTVASSLPCAFDERATPTVSILKGLPSTSDTQSVLRYVHEFVRKRTAEAEVWERLLVKNLESKLFADIESNTDETKHKENKKAEKLEEFANKASAPQTTLTFTMSTPTPLSESEDKVSSQPFHVAETSSREELCNKITNTNSEKDVQLTSFHDSGREHEDEDENEQESRDVETTIMPNSNTEQKGSKMKYNILPSNIEGTNAKQDVSDRTTNQPLQPSEATPSGELGIPIPVKAVTTEVTPENMNEVSISKAAAAVAKEEEEGKEVEEAREVKSTEELLTELQHYRAEMIDALDVCLQEIPEEEEHQEEFEEEYYYEEEEKDVEEEAKSKSTLSPTTLRLERQEKKENQFSLEEYKKEQNEKKKDCEQECEHHEEEQEKSTEEQEPLSTIAAVCEAEKKSELLPSHSPAQSTLPEESITLTNELKKNEHGVEYNHAKEIMPEFQFNNKQESKNNISSITNNNNGNDNVDNNCKLSCTQQGTENTNNISDNHAVHTEDIHLISNDALQTSSIRTRETCEKEHTVRVYTIYEWRKLLLLIVNALIQIDRVLYINYGHDMLCTRNELEMLLRAAYRKSRKYRTARRTASSGNAIVNNNDTNVMDTSIIHKVTTSSVKENVTENETHLLINKMNADNIRTPKETVSTNNNESANIHEVSDVRDVELHGPECSHEPTYSLSTPHASHKVDYKMLHYCGDEPMDKFFAASPPMSVAGEPFSGTITPLSTDGMAVVHSFSNQAHLYTTNDSDVDLMRSSTTRNSTPMLTQPNETLTGVITPSPISPPSLSHEIDRANIEDISSSSININTMNKNVKCEEVESLNKGTMSTRVEEEEEYDNNTIIANYHELAELQRKRRKWTIQERNKFDEYYKGVEHVIYSTCSIATWVILRCILQQHLANYNQQHQHHHHHRCCATRHNVNHTTLPNTTTKANHTLSNDTNKMKATNPESREDKDTTTTAMIINVEQPILLPTESTHSATCDYSRTAKVTSTSINTEIQTNTTKNINSEVLSIDKITPLAIKVDWSFIVNELIDLLKLSDSRFAESILCATFLRDDGRELMMCVLQEPQSRVLLEELLSRAKQRAAMSSNAPATVLYSSHNSTIVNYNSNSTTSMSGGNLNSTTTITAAVTNNINNNKISALTSTANSNTPLLMLAKNAPSSKLSSSATLSTSASPPPPQSSSSSSATLTLPNKQITQPAEEEIDDVIACLEKIYTESISKTWAAYLDATLTEATARVETWKFNVPSTSECEVNTNNNINAVKHVKESRNSASSGSEKDLPNRMSSSISKSSKSNSLVFDGGMANTQENERSLSLLLDEPQTINEPHNECFAHLVVDPCTLSLLATAYFYRSNEWTQEQRNSRFALLRRSLIHAKQHTNSARVNSTHKLIPQNKHNEQIKANKGNESICTNNTKREDAQKASGQQETSLPAVTATCTSIQNDVMTFTPLTQNVERKIAIDTALLPAKTTNSTELTVPLPAKEEEITQEELKSLASLSLTTSSPLISPEAPHSMQKKTNQSNTHPPSPPPSQSTTIIKNSKENKDNEKLHRENNDNVISPIHSTVQSHKNVNEISDTEQQQQQQQQQQQHINKDKNVHHFTEEHLGKGKRCLINSLTFAQSEVVERILNMSWSAALHKRIEHCLSARPPQLTEAVRCALDEKQAAHTFNDFRGKQRAYGSLVNVRMAQGKSQDALMAAQRHFANERKEWVSRGQTIFSAIRYLQSMVWLLRAHACCRQHHAVIETLQLVLPQASLCEQMLSLLAPRTRNKFILRFIESRHKILRARVYLFREAWRAYATMSDLLKAEKYFNLYVLQLRQLRKSQREMNLFEAFMERGAQLIRRKEYCTAVTLLKSAVELAQSCMTAVSAKGSNTSLNNTNLTSLHVSPSHSTPHSPPLPPSQHKATSSSSHNVNHVSVNVATSNIDPTDNNGNSSTLQTQTSSSSPSSSSHFHTSHAMLETSSIATTTHPHSNLSHPSSHTNGVSNSFYRSLHLHTAGSGSLATAEEHDSTTHMSHNAALIMECAWRLAESERMLALAYVTQAEHEVNVRERREELSHAVKCAYASQTSLQQWQAQGGTPKRLLTAVPYSLIVMGRALLLLNQAKKAALQLEPLIEDKLNSALIRPPMWREILHFTEEPLTAEDIVLRVDVNSVKMAVYLLYAQCLAKFDAERALHAIELTTQLLEESEIWVYMTRSAIVRRRGRQTIHSLSPSALRSLATEEKPLNTLASSSSLTHGNDIHTNNHGDEIKSLKHTNTANSSNNMKNENIEKVENTPPKESSSPLSSSSAVLMSLTSHTELSNMKNNKNDESGSNTLLLTELPSKAEETSETPTITTTSTTSSNKIHNYKDDGSTSSQLKEKSNVTQIKECHVKQITEPLEKKQNASEPKTSLESVRTSSQSPSNAHNSGINAQVNQIQVQLESRSEQLTALRAIQQAQSDILKAERDALVIMGDALTLQKRYEAALEVFSTALSICLSEEDNDSNTIKPTVRRPTQTTSTSKVVATDDTSSSSSSSSSSEDEESTSSSTSSTSSSSLSAELSTKLRNLRKKTTTKRKSQLKEHVQELIHEPHVSVTPEELPPPQQGQNNLIMQNKEDVKKPSKQIETLLLQEKAKESVDITPETHHKENLKKTQNSSSVHDKQDQDHQSGNERTKIINNIEIREASKGNPDKLENTETHLATSKVPPQTPEHDFNKVKTSSPKAEEQDGDNNEESNDIDEDEDEGEEEMALSEHFSEDASSTLMRDVRTAVLSEERLDLKAAQNVIFTKLANICTALKMYKPAIHYLRQVWESATESQDALLEYNSMLQLARLFALTNATEDAQHMWERVSMLAKKYEDMDVSRETTRNIIAGQQASGMYIDVLLTAAELNKLACTNSQGSEVENDRQYALEALAFAHLQLGQFEECLNVLDEREKVQEKTADWTGKVLDLRARALLGNGSIPESIKVFKVWVRKALQLQQWEELGKAYCALAGAHAANKDVFEARACHEAAMTSFTQLHKPLPNAHHGHHTLSSEALRTLLDSARWLTHYYYLNTDEVQLDPSLPDAPRVCTFSHASPLTRRFTSSGHSFYNNGNGKEISEDNFNFSNNNGFSFNGSANYSGFVGFERELANHSGDLQALLDEDERIMAKMNALNSNSNSNSSSSSSSSSDSSSDSSSEDEDEDEEKEDDDESADAFFDQFDTSKPRSSSFAAAPSFLTKNNSGSSKVMMKPDSVSNTNTPSQTTSSTVNVIPPSSSLSKVSLCKKAATLEQDDDRTKQKLGSTPIKTVSSTISSSSGGNSSVLGDGVEDKISKHDKASPLDNELLHSSSSSEHNTVGLSTSSTNSSLESETLGNEMISISNNNKSNEHGSSSTYHMESEIIHDNSNMGEEDYTKAKNGNETIEQMYNNNNNNDTTAIINKEDVDDQIVVKNDKIKIDSNDFPNEDHKGGNNEHEMSAKREGHDHLHKGHKRKHRKPHLASLLPTSENTNALNSVNKLTESQLPSRPSRVSTLCHRRALEIAEWTEQILLQEGVAFDLRIPFSPAEAIDFALISHPRSTFVFYFAEYVTSTSSSYDVVIRPAHQHQFIHRTALVTSLHKYHQLPNISPDESEYNALAVAAAGGTSGGSKSLSHTASSGTISPSLRSEVASVIFQSLDVMEGNVHSQSSVSSLHSEPRSSDNNSHSNTKQGNKQSTYDKVNSNTNKDKNESSPNAASKHPTYADRLEADLLIKLHHLYDDLWSTVESALHLAHSIPATSEFLIIVADPSLLHVPFPSLLPSSSSSSSSESSSEMRMMMMMKKMAMTGSSDSIPVAEPLGVQYTMIVTPMLSHLVSHSYENRALVDQLTSTMTNFNSNAVNAVNQYKTKNNSNVIILPDVPGTKSRRVTHPVSSMAPSTSSYSSSSESSLLLSTSAPSTLLKQIKNTINFASSSSPSSSSSSKPLHTTNQAMSHEPHEAISKENAEIDRKLFGPFMSLQEEWSIHLGCTRKEFLEWFTNSNTHRLMLLCNVDDNYLKVADGIIKFTDLISLSNLHEGNYHKTYKEKEDAHRSVSIGMQGTHPLSPTLTNTKTSAITTTNSNNNMTLPSSSTSPVSSRVYSEQGALISSQRQQRKNLELVILNTNRTLQTSVEEPGLATRLCVQLDCPRVLRVDVLPNTSVSNEHKAFICDYLRNLETALYWKMRFPYALALRMTLSEAMEKKMSANTWASFTVIGAS